MLLQHQQNKFIIHVVSSSSRSNKIIKVTHHDEVSYPIKILKSFCWEVDGKYIKVLTEKEISENVVIFSKEKIALFGKKLYKNKNKFSFLRENILKSYLNSSF